MPDAEPEASSIKASPISEPEPDPEPEPSAEPEPVDMPVAELSTEPADDAGDEASPPQLELRPSDEASFLASLDLLDHRASNHLRWLHTSLLALVDQAEYTTDGDLEHVTGWIHGEQLQPLFGLDGRGLLQLVLSTLPVDEQLEFATEVAGLIPGEADGAGLVAAGLAEVDVPAHLDDQTLLEYLVDNLVEAMPGGRESFGTVGDEDYFAGVSASHEPDDIAAAVAAGGPSDVAPAPVPRSGPESVTESARATAAQPESATVPEQRATSSRWLRRRGAA